jgi:hypothetical protein
MKYELTKAQALDMGFTHEATYYGVPCYIGDLEFASQKPIIVIVKYRYTDWLFTLISVIEWLLTPPNAGSLFRLVAELKPKEEEKE